jgi:hypothetical protein
MRGKQGRKGGGDNEREQGRGKEEGIMRGSKEGERRRG